MPEWVEVLVVDVLLIATILWLLAVGLWFSFVWFYYVIWRISQALLLHVAVNSQINTVKTIREIINPINFSDSER